MNFGELQTQVSNKIGYGDQSSKIPTYINSAIHQLEDEDDWPHMESKLSGNLTTSVDYVAIPTRYKNCKYRLFVTDSDKQKPVVKCEYDALIEANPYGSTKKDLPLRFAEKPSESNFIVRPYPDKTYAYELLVNVYSADLVANSDTNYWTDNKWEIVMYGALIQFELDSGEQLKLGTEEIPLSPNILYQEQLRLMKRNRKLRKYTGGFAYSSAAYVT